MKLLHWATLASIAISACAPAAPERDSGPGPGLRLSSPRATHANVLLADGRVMLIGGCARGSCDPGPGSSTADIVDPKSGKVTSVPLAMQRIGAEAVRLGDGRVLVLGGWTGVAPTAEAEIFDPKSGRSRRIAPMTAARADTSVVALADGRVLVAGGFDGTERLGSAELFDPASERFIPAGAMNLARSGAAIARLPDGRVLLTGGAVGPARDVRATAATEIFDPAAMNFSRAPDLLEARYKHAAVSLKSGEVLIVAGSDERDYRGKKASLEIYDPKQNALRAAGRLQAERFKLADAAVLLRDGRVLIAGGAPRPEIFDPATGRTRVVPMDLGGAWNFMTADLLPDGRALLAGGYTEGRIEITDRVWLLQL